MRRPPGRQSQRGTPSRGSTEPRQRRGQRSDVIRADVLVRQVERLQRRVLLQVVRRERGVVLDGVQWGIWGVDYLQQRQRVQYGPGLRSGRQL